MRSDPWGHLGANQVPLSISHPAAAPLLSSVSPFINKNHEPDPQHEAFCNVAMKTGKENQ